MKNNLFLLLFCFLFPESMFNAQVSFTITPKICKNDTTHLTASTGSLSNSTFTWSSNPVGGIFSSPNNSITAITFTNAVTFTVILTCTSGTVMSSYQNTLDAVPLPLILLTQNGPTTCIANNFPLFSKPVNLMASGGLSYTWNPTFVSMTGPPNGPSNTVRPATNSCFSVTGVDANGCKSMASICVTVIPRFTTNISPQNAVLCRANNNDEVVVLTLGATVGPAYSPSSSYTYSWTEFSLLDNILTSTLLSTIAVSPFATATYTAEINDAINCVSLPAMVTVSVTNCNDLKTNSSVPSLITVYPNPVKEKLYIQINTKSSNLKIILTNSLGQTVKVINNAITEIDLKDLLPGIYFLNVWSSDEIETTKILKE